MLAFDEVARLERFRESRKANIAAEIRLIFRMAVQHGREGVEERFQKIKYFLPRGVVGGRCGSRICIIAVFSRVCVE